MHSRTFTVFLSRSVMMILLCSVFFVSCNVPALVDRKQVKKFNRKDIAAYSFYDTDGTKRYVHATSNDLPKLMLLHGYGASGIGQYYRTALELRDEYDLILPDLLYCGHSTGNNKDYSIDHQVEHLRMILDSLKCEGPMVVAGNSYGGIVAAYFAEKYPDKVKKLVIYDSPVNFYTLNYADSLAHSLEVESVRNLLSPMDVRENKISLDLVFHDQPYIPRFLRRQMVKYGSLPVRDNQVKMLEELIASEQKMNEHTFRWKMPVYLLWGDSDKLIPLETCHKIAAKYHIPQERIHIFKNAAHAANVEYPDEFISVIRKIMNE